ncbi:hypothetical protein ROLI_017950 [Roseobacter fucihabitans]|uniref:Uncharacterized protein n=1 Tax=Roseobacter fucihabitans TaxID=1537242 RepID=A0ABZ2BV06_9RHOB|nr:hypothetical protein [Roseobacter litoralis]
MKLRAPVRFSALANPLRPVGERLRCDPGTLVKNALIGLRSGRFLARLRRHISTLTEQTNAPLVDRDATAHRATSKLENHETVMIVPGPTSIEVIKSFAPSGCVSSLQIRGCRRGGTAIVARVFRRHEPQRGTGHPASAFDPVTEIRSKGVGTGWQIAAALHELLGCQTQKGLLASWDAARVDIGVAGAMPMST